MILKTIICSVLTSFLFFFGCAIKKNVSTKSDQKKELYLLVGQSNMAGRGEIEPVDREVHPRVFSMAADYSWVPASEPLHFDKVGRGTGPGLSFGKAMAEAKPSVRIGLIPCAVGGTKISYWKPGAERKLFETAVQRAKIAMKSGELKGIVWQQGESDSNTADAPLYKERLLELLRAFRKELGNEKLPIVLGGLGSFLKSEKYKIVNQALQETAQELPHTAFSPASSQGDIGDRLHFNSKAQRENGVNMAKAMLMLQ